MNVAVDMEGRWQRLKASTAPTHESLDKRIMASGAFGSKEVYGKFAQMQHAFHRDIDALYSDARLDALLPDLPGRRRFGQIEQDLNDLGLAPLELSEAPVFGKDADLPTALGWLYVAEGSNLGAAFLIKAAERIGLSEEHGARHLGGHPEGRGKHWRSFTAALDALDLSEEEDARLVAGAEAAFRRVHSLADRVFA